MTAPKDRPEIQRYEAHAIRMMNGVHYASLRRHDSGKSVLYSDHLRHLKLAQIAVLKELAVADIPTVAPNDPSRYIFSSVTKVTIHNKIAALRKELEG